MPIRVDATRQAVANAYTGLALFGSVHTADPGTTGASEVSGGTPTYARKSLAWTAGTTGTGTASATYDIPSGITAAWGGIWSAVTAGTFRDTVDIVDQAFASQGQLTINYTYTQT
jgi:hypothetical protein